MLSASCSIETPAFTRRTLDWLKTSLLKGISREGLSLIFWTLAMSDSPRRATGRRSLDLQPVTNKPARLSLSDAQHQLKAETAVRMHHAASSLPSTRDSITGGRKVSKKSAAFDAALAARTTARLSSRNTSSQEPI